MFGQRAATANEDLVEGTVSLYKGKTAPFTPVMITKGGLRSARNAVGVHARESTGGYLLVSFTDDPGTAYPVHLSEVHHIDYH